MKIKILVERYEDKCTSREVWKIEMKINILVDRYEDACRHNVNWESENEEWVEDKTEKDREINVNRH